MRIAKVCLMIVGLALIAWAQESDSKTEVSFEQKLLARILPDVFATDISFSPDGKSVAYIAWENGNYLIVVEDIRGEKFAYVGSPIFSPDGKTVAYEAMKAGKYFVVVGHKKGEAFDWVGKPVFSPDGKTVAYKATKEGKSFIVVGDKKGEEFDEVWPPVFSPDGKKVAFGARVLWRNELWWIVRNLQ